MNATRLPNGKIRIPRRAEGPQGTLGDGVVEIGPDDPEYAAWDRWLKANPHPNDHDDETRESIFREHQAKPPFPGAVFDDTIHRWVKGGSPTPAPAPATPDASGNQVKTHTRRAKDVAGAEHYLDTAKQKPVSKALRAAGGLSDVARRRRVIHAVKNEGELSEAIQGHNLPDSKPADVVHMVDAAGAAITDPQEVKTALVRRQATMLTLTTGTLHTVSRFGKLLSSDHVADDHAREFAAQVIAEPCHFFEVKTLLTTPRDEVHMNPKALKNKVRWVEKYGVTFHTVMIDDRRGAKHSGHRIYVVPNGLGSTVKLSDGEKATDMADVYARVKAKEDEGRKAVIAHIKHAKGLA